MLSQSPPDSPTLSSEHAKRSWWKGLWFVIGILLLGYFMPTVLRRRGAELAKATNNANQLFIHLTDFELDYGKFPDHTTADVIDSGNSHRIIRGRSSNALLRQLIYGGYADVESIFYADTKDAKNPDGVINGPYPPLEPGAKALESGECGFAYITDQTTKSAPDTPILATPMIPGTTKFDPEIHEGKAVTLRIDGSARAENIAPDGHVYVNGMDIFDPRQPYWGGKAPVIAYPE